MAIWPVGSLSDDFIEGVAYRPLARVTGGIFPKEIEPTTRHEYQGGEQPGHLRFFRCDLQGEGEIRLQGGKRYAFMLGFEALAKDQGLVLGIDSGIIRKLEPASSHRRKGILKN